jgi:TPP-dependent 2-oxoacid decarboxylase
MTQATIATYIIARLKQAGLRHAFGVPGDYVLSFMDRLIEGGIELIGTCNELNAGYAADAYARIKGIGCVCVTWGVGGFSAMNAIAGAYAEQVPARAPHNAVLPCCCITASATSAPCSRLIRTSRRPR